MEGEKLSQKSVIVKFGKALRAQCRLCELTDLAPFRPNPGQKIPKNKQDTLPFDSCGEVWSDRAGPTECYSFRSTTKHRYTQHKSIFSVL